MEGLRVTYFQRNSQRTPQWNPRRRNGHTDSGVVVVHTFEAPAGRTCTWGANFLRTRTDYGSYHWLADALGYTLHLAPWSAETWHETTVNNWSVGISMMAYAANWRKITPTQRRNLIRGAALGAHRYSRWRVSQGKSAVPARRISRAQALARVPGFIGHGEIDTKRRTDPGAHFPWNDFLAEYARLESRTPASNVSPTTPTSPGRDWFDMATKNDLRDVVRAELDRYAATRPNPNDGAREKRFRYHDRDSQLLYAAVAGLELPIVSGQVAGLTEAVKQLAGGQGVDPAQIEAAVAKGVADAIAGVEADVTLNINTTQED